MTGPLGEPRGRLEWQNYEKRRIRWLLKDLQEANEQIKKLETEIKRLKSKEKNREKY